MEDGNRAVSSAFSRGGLSTQPYTNAHTHLCAVALAAEVGACGPDGLCRRAAVDMRAGGAVGYGRTVIVCEINQSNNRHRGRK